jgi:DNA primase
MMAELDLHGRVVAFVGQALEEPTDAELGEAGLQPNALLEARGSAEQLGCPESLVHRPQQLVLGLHQARQAIRAADRAVLASGCFDVLSLHAHGIQNAVAAATARPTTEQALLIKRFTTRVTVLCSADPAGRRAVASAREVFRHAGLLVKVATLPPGTGVAGLVAERGAETVRQALGAARGLMEFLIDSTLDSQLSEDEPHRRIAKVRYVAGLLASEPDPLVRALSEQYVDDVVQRLRIGRALTFRQLSGEVQRELAEAPRAHPPPTGLDGVEVAHAQSGAADATGRAVLGALLDFPELLGDEALGWMLQRLEGSAAAAVAAARRAWERLAPELRQYAQDRVRSGAHASADEARATIVTMLGRSD